ncbi:MAG TPA: hypothetical protein VH479_18870 [Acidimicrobiales bacterium]
MVGSAPASASATAEMAIAEDCDFVGSATADSGVSRISVNLEYCLGLGYYLAYVTVWDTSCDNRTAYGYLQVNFVGTITTVSASGCGHRTDTTLGYYSIRPMEIWTKACNGGGCSSQSPKSRIDGWG